MQTLKEFRPSGFDPGGGFLPDKADWLVVPVMRTRDSDHLARSNFEAAISALQGKEADFDLLRYRHWGCGHFEILIVREDTEAATAAEQIEQRLEHYPVLDSADFTAREFDAYKEAWRDGEAKCFLDRLMAKFRQDRDADDDALDDIEDRLRAVIFDLDWRLFFEDRNTSGSYCQDAYPSLDESVESTTLADIQDFLDGPYQAGAPVHEVTDGQGTLPL